MRRGSPSRERKETFPADRRGHTDLQNPAGAVRQGAFGYPGLSIMFVRGYRLFSDFAYGQTADSRQTQEDQAEPQDGVGAVAGLRDGVGAAVGTAVGAAVRAVVETGVGAGSGSGGCRN